MSQKVSFSLCCGENLVKSVKTLRDGEVLPARSSFRNISDAFTSAAVFSRPRHSRE